MEHKFDLTENFVLLVNPEGKDYSETNNVFNFNNEKINNRRFKIINSKNIEIGYDLTFIVELNDDFKFLKNVVNKFNVFYKAYNSLCLKDDSKKCKITFIVYDKNSSKYYDDFINCIKTVSLAFKHKQQDFAYDKACEYLDKQFCENNYCNFENNACVANRSGLIPHDCNGCCYSFEYTGLIDYRMIKNIQLCKYQKNKTCTAHNLGCKLFTCKYLKKKNIQFNYNDYLLLVCFFTKKELKILTSNFFRSKEELFERIKKKDYLPYWLFVGLNRYKIKQPM